MQHFFFGSGTHWFLKDIPRNGSLHCECNVIFIYLKLLFYVVGGRVYIRSSLWKSVYIIWEVPVWCDGLFLSEINTARPVYSKALCYEHLCHPDLHITKEKLWIWWAAVYFINWICTRNLSWKDQEVGFLELCLTEVLFCCFSHYEM